MGQVWSTRKEHQEKKGAFDILTLLFKENEIPTFPLSHAECICCKSSQLH